MNRFLRRAPACAFASAILFVAVPALAQSGSEGAAAPDASGAAPSAPGAKAAAPGGATLPGVVLERNVFVPVDASGKPASNQFIVVERRVLTKEGDEGKTGGETTDVPTHFILVPEDAGSDAEAPGGAAQ